MIETASLCILVFLLLTHLLNWYSDQITYQASFPLSVIKNAQEPVNLVTEESPEVEWFENKNPISASNIAQKISLYWQHLLLPISAGVWAVIVVLCEP